MPGLPPSLAGHEEKETDVNIALYLVNEAYKNSYDTALILSRDSDLKPAIAMIRKEFSDKEVIAVAPPSPWPLCGFAERCLCEEENNQKAG